MGLPHAPVAIEGAHRLKKIEAIVKPFKLDDIKDRLDELGVHGMTVSEVKGFGRGGGKAPIYPGAEYIIDFVPNIKIELVIDDALVHTVIDALLESAYTGHVGDGKIFVLPVEEAVRIRTGERGPDALS